MRLALFGPPGAGKGTQAKRLAARHDLDHVSTGDLFRAAIREQTALGKTVKGLLENGELVPDDVTNDLVAERLASQPDGGFVLDGFPRTVAQAEWLIAHLAAAGRPLDAVVSLRVPDEAVVERLSNRRTDPETGAIYHLEFNPPPDSLPASRLVRRSDDEPAAIRHRLQIYHDETHPVEAYLRAHVRFFEVDGTGPLEAVEARITEAITADRGLDGL